MAAVLGLEFIYTKFREISEVLLPANFTLDKKAVLQLINFSRAQHPYGGTVESVIAVPSKTTNPKTKVHS